MSKVTSTTSADAQIRSAFNTIIDVRSPSEFAEDHVPGAINLPVLNDAERARVGTLYKQVSPFQGRQVGAAIVARNIATHLDTFFADQHPSQNFLIYCWRGGMRSNAMATIVSQVGWRVSVLEGGYKTWRRQVVAGTRESSAPLQLVLLDGRTGTGKTDILHAARTAGAQVLDLEGLANHRGSVFGGMGAQPSQKLFESRLHAAMEELDLSRPVLVEAESCKIGKREIPSRIWKAMQTALHIRVQADLATRAEYLTRAYADFVRDEGRVLTAISRLTTFHPKQRIADWQAMVNAQDHAKLAMELMQFHYDPLYDKAQKARCHKALHVLDMAALDDGGFGSAGEHIRMTLDAMPPLPETD